VYPSTEKLNNKGVTNKVINKMMMQLFSETHHLFSETLSDSIIEELKQSPTVGIGNPEPLKHNLSGFWSRRINKKDRLIYQIIEEPDNLVVILSALGHYD
jgi:Txe/YoeB family toxin of toxin-antitoxin system